MHAALSDFGLRQEPLSTGAPAGMSAAVEAIFRAALSAPSGIVLIAGAAGSGRTATLDAGLALHPGALIVGEIRDRETADMAVQSALAGALVLAAIDAGNAVGAVIRLKALAIEPFLIASTLRAVLAQRLVRRLCRGCRRPVQAAASLAARLGFDPGAIVHESPGCARCGHKGHEGWIALYEAIDVDVAMRRLISGGGDAAVIASHAFRDRPDLAGAARAAALGGAISAEDALRPC